MSEWFIACGRALSKRERMSWPGAAATLGSIRHIHGIIARQTWCRACQKKEHWRAGTTGYGSVILGNPTNNGPWLQYGECGDCGATHAFGMTNYNEEITVVVHPTLWVSDPDERPAWSTHCPVCLAKQDRISQPIVHPCKIAKPANAEMVSLSRKSHHIDIKAVGTSCAFWYQGQCHSCGLDHVMPGVFEYTLVWVPPEQRGEARDGPR